VQGNTRELCRALTFFGKKLKCFERAKYAVKLIKCKRVLNTARRDVSIVCGKIMRAEFDISKSDNESKNKSLNVIERREAISRYLKRLHTVERPAIF